MKEQRKQIWFKGFQTHLLLRITLYGFIFQFTVLNLLFIWKTLRDGEGTPLMRYGAILADHLPVLICFVLVAPFVVWDALRLTHRLTGPLVPIRRTIQAVTRGEQVPHLVLRKDDYLQELKDDLNALLESLQRRGVDVLQAPPEPAKTPSGSQPAEAVLH